jgi:hypothetical protein
MGDTKLAHDDNESAGQLPSIGTTDLINASGHAQELNRQFNVVSLAGVGLVVGNV